MLRGVVEEGLNERQRAKEDAASANASIASQAYNRQAEPSVNDIGTNMSRAEIPSPPPSRPTSPALDQQQRSRKGRGKLRFAFRSSGQPHDRFIDDEELERVSAELEERRSVRSESNDSQACEPENLSASARKTASRIREGQRAGHARARKSDLNTSSDKRASKPEVERERFPYLQSRHLEQLFFSAPDHNAQTCRLCHRRQRPDHADENLDFPSFLPPRKRARLSHDDGAPRRRQSDSLHQEGRLSGAPFSKDHLPPQTVLARVLSELEDEFSHYKG